MDIIVKFLFYSGRYIIVVTTQSFIEALKKSSQLKTKIMERIDKSFDVIGSHENILQLFNENFESVGDVTNVQLAFISDTHKVKFERYLKRLEKSVHNMEITDKLQNLTNNEYAVWNQSQMNSSVMDQKAFNNLLVQSAFAPLSSIKNDNSSYPHCLKKEEDENISSDEKIQEIIKSEDHISFNDYYSNVIDFTSADLNQSAITKHGVNEEVNSLKNNDGDLIERPLLSRSNSSEVSSGLLDSPIMSQLFNYDTKSIASVIVMDNEKKINYFVKNQVTDFCKDIEVNLRSLRNRKERNLLTNTNSRTLMRKLIGIKKDGSTSHHSIYHKLISKHDTNASKWNGSSDADASSEVRNDDRNASLQTDFESTGKLLQQNMESFKVFERRLHDIRIKRRLDEIRNDRIREIHNIKSTGDLESESNEKRLTEKAMKEVIKDLSHNLDVTMKKLAVNETRFRTIEKKLKHLEQLSVCSSKSNVRDLLSEISVNVDHDKDIELLKDDIKKIEMEIIDDEVQRNTNAHQCNKTLSRSAKQMSTDAHPKKKERSSLKPPNKDATIKKGLAKQDDEILPKNKSQTNGQSTRKMNKTTTIKKKTYFHSIKDTDPASKPKPYKCNTNYKSDILKMPLKSYPNALPKEDVQKIVGPNFTRRNNKPPMPKPPTDRKLRHRIGETSLRQYAEEPTRTFNVVKSTAPTVTEILGQKDHDNVNENQIDNCGTRTAEEDMDLQDRFSAGDDKPVDLTQDLKEEVHLEVSEIPLNLSEHDSVLDSEPLDLSSSIKHDLKEDKLKYKDTALGIKPLYVNTNLQQDSKEGLFEGSEDSLGLNKYDSVLDIPPLDLSALVEKTAKGVKSEEGTETTDDSSVNIEPFDLPTCVAQETRQEALQKSQTSMDSDIIKSKSPEPMEDNEKLSRGAQIQKSVEEVGSFSQNLYSNRIDNKGEAYKFEDAQALKSNKVNLTTGSGRDADQLGVDEGLPVSSKQELNSSEESVEFHNAIQQLSEKLDNAFNVDNKLSIDNNLKVASKSTLKNEKADLETIKTVHAQTNFVKTDDMTAPSASDYVSSVNNAILDCSKKTEMNEQNFKSDSNDKTKTTNNFVSTASDYISNINETIENGPPSTSKDKCEVPVFSTIDLNKYNMADAEGPFEYRDAIMSNNISIKKPLTNIDSDKMIRNEYGDYEIYKAREHLENKELNKENKLDQDDRYVSKKDEERMLNADKTCNNRDSTSSYELQKVQEHLINLDLSKTSKFVPIDEVLKQQLLQCCIGKTVRPGNICYDIKKACEHLKNKCLKSELLINKYNDVTDHNNENLRLFEEDLMKAFEKINKRELKSLSEDADIKDTNHLKISPTLSWNNDMVTNDPSQLGGLNDTLHDIERKCEENQSQVSNLSEHEGVVKETYNCITKENEDALDSILNNLNDIICDKNMADNIMQAVEYNENARANEAAYESGEASTNNDELINDPEEKFKKMSNLLKSIIATIQAHKARVEQTIKNYEDLFRQNTVDVMIQKQGGVNDTTFSHELVDHLNQRGSNFSTTTSGLERFKTDLSNVYDPNSARLLINRENFKSMISDFMKEQKKNDDFFQRFNNTIENIESKRTSADSIRNKLGSTQYKSFLNEYSKQFSELHEKIDSIAGSSIETVGDKANEMTNEVDDKCTYLQKDFLAEQETKKGRFEDQISKLSIETVKNQSNVNKNTPLTSNKMPMPKAQKENVEIDKMIEANKKAFAELESTLKVVKIIGHNPTGNLSLQNISEETSENPKVEDKKSIITYFHDNECNPLEMITSAVDRNDSERVDQPIKGFSSGLTSVRPIDGDISFNFDHPNNASDLTTQNSSSDIKEVSSKTNGSILGKSCESIKTISKGSDKEFSSDKRSSHSSLKQHEIKKKEYHTRCINMSTDAKKEEDKIVKEDSPMALIVTHNTEIPIQMMPMINDSIFLNNFNIDKSLINFEVPRKELISLGGEESFKENYLKESITENVLFKKLISLEEVRKFFGFNERKTSAQRVDKTTNIEEQGKKAKVLQIPETKPDEVPVQKPKQTSTLMLNFKDVLRRKRSMAKSNANLEENIKIIREQSLRKRHTETKPVDTRTQDEIEKSLFNYKHKFSKKRQTKSLKNEQKLLLTKETLQDAQCIVTQLKDFISKTDFHSNDIPKIGTSESKKDLIPKMDSSKNDYDGIFKLKPTQSTKDKCSKTDLIASSSTPKTEFKNVSKTRSANLLSTKFETKLSERISKMSAKSDEITPKERLDNIPDNSNNLKSEEQNNVNYNAILKAVTEFKERMQARSNETKIENKHISSVQNNSSGIENEQENRKNVNVKGVDKKYTETSQLEMPSKKEDTEKELIYKNLLNSNQSKPNVSPIPKEYIDPNKSSSINQVENKGSRESPRRNVLNLNEIRHEASKFSDEYIFIEPSKIETTRNSIGMIQIEDIAERKEKKVGKAQTYRTVQLEHDNQHHKLEYVSAIRKLEHIIPKFQLQHSSEKPVMNSINPTPLLENPQPTPGNRQINEISDVKAHDNSKEDNITRPLESKQYKQYMKPMHQTTRKEIRKNLKNNEKLLEETEGNSKEEKYVVHPLESKHVKVIRQNIRSESQKFTQSNDFIQPKDANSKKGRYVVQPLEWENTSSEPNIGNKTILLKKPQLMQSISKSKEDFEVKGDKEHSVGEHFLDVKEEFKIGTPHLPPESKPHENFLHIKGERSHFPHFEIKQYTKQGNKKSTKYSKSKHETFFQNAEKSSYADSIDSKHHNTRKMREHLKILAEINANSNKTKRKFENIYKQIAELIPNLPETAVKNPQLKTWIPKRNHKQLKISKDEDSDHSQEDVSDVSKSENVINAFPKNMDTFNQIRILPQRTMWNPHYAGGKKLWKRLQHVKKLADEKNADNLYVLGTKLPTLRTSTSRKPPKLTEKLLPVKKPKQYQYQVKKIKVGERIMNITYLVEVNEGKL